MVRREQEAEGAWPGMQVGEDWEEESQEEPMFGALQPRGER